MDSSLLHIKHLFTKETPPLFKQFKVKILPQDASHEKKPNLVRTHKFQTTLIGKAYALLIRFAFSHQSMLKIINYFCWQPSLIYQPTLWLEAYITLLSNKWVWSPLNPSPYLSLEWRPKKGSIQTPHKGTSLKEVFEETHHLHLNKNPTSLPKIQNETIWPRSFIPF